jgi:hypothetical protein
MIDDLLRQLAIAPVMGKFHPLLPLCLPANTEVQLDARRVAIEMDDRAASEVRPILITNLDLAYANRFITATLTSLPDVGLLNRGLPGRLEAARSLLTNRHIADRIVEDTIGRDYRVVILMLVDGLSYEDVRHWPEEVEPTFIDGPSITFSRTTGGDINREVGFPAIVGIPPLAQRLLQVGLKRARGYSYWDRESNDVAAIMFEGMPLQRVGGVDEALGLLVKESLDGLYVQLVRVGTDGLAHGRREVGIREVGATVEAVRQDLLHLVDILRQAELRGAVYLTADHGMLWKNHHSLIESEDYRSPHPRYTAGTFSDDAPVSRLETQGGVFSLYHYPYLGTAIRANNSGVHGGLSYWESIVPFIRIEVNV